LRPAGITGLRAKRLLSVWGGELSRPYYLCKPCGEGQFPVDQQLDVEKTKNTPAYAVCWLWSGTNRFPRKGANEDSGRSGSWTTKAVERTAEAIGEDNRPARTREIARALQLDLPEMMGPRFRAILEMDGTCALVKKETAIDRARRQDNRPIPGGQAGCVLRKHLGREGYALRDPDSPLTPGPSMRRDFGTRIMGAWKRGWSRARLNVVLGDGAEWIGTLRLHFPGAIQIVASIMLAKISGSSSCPTPQRPGSAEALDDVPPNAGQGRIEKLVRSCGR